jgi:protease-4
MRTLIAAVLLPALIWGEVGCIVYAPQNFGLPAISGVKERTLEEADSFWTRDKIAVVGVEGTITSRSASDFKERLKAVRDDDNVRAVVLRLDTPGGSVTASDQMYRELRDFKRETGMPVIALMMDVAASGGYYVAMAADEVLAHPTSVTGSIGVVVQVLSVEGLFELVGLEQRTLKSGALKDMGSPFRPMTDEERELFQHIVDADYERFLEVVDAGRPHLGRDEVRALADGRVFVASQALEVGLIDSIGYFDDALDWAKQAAHIKDAEVVGYQLGPGYRENVYGAIGAEPSPEAGAPGTIDLGLDRLLPTPGAHFLYLWTP